MWWSSLIGVVEDGGNDDDEVFDVRHAVQQVRRDPGQVFVGEIAARKNVNNCGLVLFIQDVDYARSRFELEVGYEVISQYLGLLLYLVQVAAVRQGEKHAVLGLGVHLFLHPVNLGVFESHSLFDLELRAVHGQVGTG